MTETKLCKECGVEFAKPYKYSATQWALRLFCTQACAGKHNVNKADGGWNKLRHGHSRIGRATRTYKAWQSMLQRCTNERHKHYARYGGRGITVCERWMVYENFLADLGECPPGLTLEREKNERGYEPGNCHWATRQEQALNTSLTTFYEFNGERLPAATWADRLGYSVGGLKKRVRRLGLEIALVTPRRKA